MNNDPFKKNWTQLEGTDAELVKQTKELAENLLGAFNLVEPTREISLAKTKLEEAMIWFTKGFVLQVDARKGESTHA